MNKVKRSLALIFLPTSFCLADQVQWAPVEKGPEQSVVRLAGHVVPKDGALSIESARVQGRVTSILKREGEPVKIGDPLFMISSAECVSLQQERAVAEARKLNDLIDAADRREQELSLSLRDNHCQMLATHDGVLTKRQVELGATFNVGDALATIVDSTQLTVELEAAEEDIPVIKPGQDVKIYFEALRDRRPALTRVANVVPAIDAATRTARVRLTPFVSPAGITVDSLAWGEIRIVGKQTVFRVPSSAVVFQSGKRYVIKKTGSRNVVIDVRVLGESENFSLIQPDKLDDLVLGDSIAVRGAVFLLNDLKESL